MNHVPESSPDHIRKRRLQLAFIVCAAAVSAVAAIALVREGSEPPPPALEAITGHWSIMDTEGCPVSLRGKSLNIDEATFRILGDPEKEIPYIVTGRGYDMWRIALKKQDPELGRGFLIRITAPGEMKMASGIGGDASQRWDMTLRSEGTP